MHRHYRFPAEIPLTRVGLPDMRYTVSKNFVADQAAMYGFDNIPVWVPRKYTGEIDESQTSGRHYVEGARRRQQILSNIAKKEIGVLDASKCNDSSHVVDAKMDYAMSLYEAMVKAAEQQVAKKESVDPMVSLPAMKIEESTKQPVKEETVSAKKAERHILKATRIKKEISKKENGILDVRADDSLKFSDNGENDKSQHEALVKPTIEECASAQMVSGPEMKADVRSGLMKQPVKVEVDEWGHCSCCRYKSIGESLSASFGVATISTFDMTSSADSGLVTLQDSVQQSTKVDISLAEEALCNSAVPESNWPDTFVPLVVSLESQSLMLPQRSSESIIKMDTTVVDEVKLCGKRGIIQSGSMPLSRSVAFYMSGDAFIVSDKEFLLKFPVFQMPMNLGMFLDLASGYGASSSCLISRPAVEKHEMKHVVSRRHQNQLAWLAAACSLLLKLFNIMNSSKTVFCAPVSPVEEFQTSKHQQFPICKPSLFFCCELPSGVGSDLFENWPCLPQRPRLAICGPPVKECLGSVNLIRVIEKESVKEEVDLADGNSPSVVEIESVDGPSSQIASTLPSAKPKLTQRLSMAISKATKSFFHRRKSNASDKVTFGKESGINLIGYRSYSWL